MSDFWSYYIIAIVAINIVGSAALLMWTRKGSGKEGETTGHVYDGIEELNNPLPQWWLGLFWVTLIFSVVYLYFYPGFGKHEGSLNWSSEKQWQEQVEKAELKAKKIFDVYAESSVAELADNDAAMETGRRLFLQHCSACHGSSATGAKGYPDLTDSDWLYGGAEANVKHSITQGRNNAMMPPLGAALGEQGNKDVITYLRSLNQGDSSTEQAQAGKQKYDMMCMACHGPEAKGNIYIGAPDLSDDVWLYGGSDEEILETLMKGRQGKMPAHKDIMSEQKIHVLTAYILSLGE